MGRADAVCAKYRRPAGVTFTLQVCTYSIEPTMPNRACNLLSNDRCRAALADEAEENWPEVALVVDSALLSCAGEWLAWA
jgi:hypothetical protein